MKRSPTRTGLASSPAAPTGQPHSAPANLEFLGPLDGVPTKTILSSVFYIGDGGSAEERPPTPDPEPDLAPDPEPDLAPDPPSLQNSEQELAPEADPEPTPDPTSPREDEITDSQIRINRFIAAAIVIAAAYHFLFKKSQNPDKETPSTSPKTPEHDALQTLPTRSKL